MAEGSAPADHSQVVGPPTLSAVVRAMSWVGAGHIVGQAFWLGSLIVLAALLPPRAFGTVTVGLLLVTAGTRLQEAGTRGSIIIAPRLSRQQLGSSLALNLGVGIAITVGVVLLAGPIVDNFARGGDALVLRVLAFSMLLYAPAIVPLALLEKRFAFKERAGVQASATISASTISVVAAALGAGVWALVVRQLVFQGLLAVLGWLGARRLLPPREEGARPWKWERFGHVGATGFLLFSLTDFVVFNADYVTVGRLTDATQLGLYSLAFTIAFAPVRQFSAQIGSVLFPAAAASDSETIRRRTLKGVRLTSLVLFPLVPVGIALAPVLVPAVLGDRWRGMVAPLQILIVVGAAHAVLNVIGESLSGTGNIGFRARVNLVWMIGMIVALVVLVRADGIRGAAIAHLALYAPVAVAYGIWGMQLLGLDTRLLSSALREVLAPLAVQAAVTAGVIVGLRGVGVAEAVRVAVGASLGFAAGAAILVGTGRSALYEAKAFFTAGRRGAA